MGKRACSAPSCSNSSYKNKGLSFFRVPKGDRGKKWIVNMRREDLLKFLEERSDYLYENIKLCAVHFEHSQFMNEKKNSLKHDALPTLFNVPNPPPSVEISRPNPMETIRKRQAEIAAKEKKEKVEQTLLYIRSRKDLFTAQRKRRKENAKKNSLLRRALHAKRQSLYRLQKKFKRKYLQMNQGRGATTLILESLKSVLTSDEMTLLESRLKNSKKRRNVYCLDYKRLAFSLSYKGTASYQVLAKKLKLPPKRTISRWTNNIRFAEGLEEEKVFQIMGEKAKSMEQRDRLATLLLDEISLREHCQYDQNEDKIIGVKRQKDGSFSYMSYALVTMVTGLKAKWRQTLSYFFSKGGMNAQELMNVVHKTITKLDEVGIKVMNVTCDQGSNNTSLLSLMNVSPDKPYFELLGRKIYCTPDPPHLIKSCRNCLFEHNIMTEDGLASWTHLRAFYNQDKLNVIKMAPKLTDNHLEPPPVYGKMVVRWATQVLSHSVAKGMQACIQNTTLSKMVSPTSYFCEKFDTIFDLMNSSRRHDPKPFKRGLTPDSVDQLNFIQVAIKYIRSLKVMDKDGKIINNKFRWMEGMVMALNSIKGLAIQLCTYEGFDFLLTRRLNQDGLENYFSIIRQRNGFDHRPTCYGFITAYKITMVN